MIHTFLSKAFPIAWSSSLVLATSRPATILFGRAKMLIPVDKSETLDLKPHIGLPTSKTYYFVGFYKK